MDFEAVGVLGEHAEVLFGDALADLFFLRGIDQSDAGSLEAGTGETAAVDAVGLAHDVVDGYQLFTATLVVLDAALATLETELTKEGKIAGLPSGNALADTLVLAVEMFGTAGKTGRHLLLGEVVGLFGDVAQVGLVEALEGHAGVGHHVPGGCLALGHTQVVVAIDEAAGEATEDDGEFELGHTGVLADDAVLLGVGIEEEQGIFLAQGDTGLVENTISKSDIFAFGLAGNLDDFHGSEGDAVGFGKGHDICNEHSGTGREASDGEAAFDDSLETVGELEALLQSELGTTGIVAPIAFLHTGGFLNVKINFPIKGETTQADMSVIGGGEQQVNTHIEGKAGNEAVLVVDVGTEGADTVGGENMVSGLFTEEAAES